MEKFKNCYLCKHCQKLPNSSYSKCNKAEPVSSELIKRPPVKIEQYGKIMGWCDWPYRYDPVWVNSCDWYEGRIPDEKAKSFSLKDTIEPPQRDLSLTLKGRAKFTTMLKPELRQALERIAINKQMSVADVLELIISEYLDLDY